MSFYYLAKHVCMYVCSVMHTLLSHCHICKYSSIHKSISLQTQSHRRHKLNYVFIRRKTTIKQSNSRNTSIVEYSRLHHFVNRLDSCSYVYYINEIFQVCINVKSFVYIYFLHIYAYMQPMKLLCLTHILLPCKCSYSQLMRFLIKI